MRTMKKYIAALGMATGIMGAALSVSATELRIGTASQEGAYYPIGQSISSLVNEHAEGLTMVPIVTGGSVQNPRLVNSNEVDIAITNNNLAVLANDGAAMYAKSGKMNLKAIGSLHFSVLHIIALDGSTVNAITDLKGKRVAVGPAGGGTIQFLDQVFSLYGMSMSDITPSFLSYGDGFSQLADGNVDAALALSGYPASAVMQAGANKELKFINLSDDVMEKALDKYKNYSRVVIPKEVYGVAEDGVALGVSNMLVVNTDMEDDTAYQITRAIYDHMDEFKASNANAKQIDPARSMSLGIPLHPGSMRYFSEK